MLSVVIQAATKIESPVAEEIVSYSLFNYDNLIADSYESSKEYIQQLAHLLHKGTGYPSKNFKTILMDDELASESDPVKYMLLINRKTSALTGYYFVDD